METISISSGVFTYTSHRVTDIVLLPKNWVLRARTSTQQQFFVRLFKFVQNSAELRAVIIIISSVGVVMKF